MRPERVLDRPRNSRQRDSVEDHLAPVQGRGEPLGVGRHVDLEQRRGRVQVLAFTGGEVVDDDDLVAALDQQVDQVEPMSRLRGEANFMREPPQASRRAAPMQHSRTKEGLRFSAAPASRTARPRDGGQRRSTGPVTPHPRARGRSLPPALPGSRSGTISPASPITSGIAPDDEPTTGTPAAIASTSTHRTARGAAAGSSPRAHQHVQRFQETEHGIVWRRRKDVSW